MPVPRFAMSTLATSFSLSLLRSSSLAPRSSREPSLEAQRACRALDYGSPALLTLAVSRARRASARWVRCRPAAARALVRVRRGAEMECMSRCRGREPAWLCAAGRSRRSTSEPLTRALAHARGTPRHAASTMSASACAGGRVGESACVVEGAGAGGARSSWVRRATWASWSLLRECSSARGSPCARQREKEDAPPASALELELMDEPLLVVDAQVGVRDEGDLGIEGLEGRVEGGGLAREFELGVRLVRVGVGWRVRRVGCGGGGRRRGEVGEADERGEEGCELGRVELGWSSWWCLRCSSHARQRRAGRSAEGAGESESEVIALVLVRSHHSSELPGPPLDQP